MTHTENLLVCLLEESNEVQQRVTKAMRWGINEIQEGQPFTNAERVVYEFNDMIAVMELMLDEGIIKQIIDRTAIEKKKRNLKDGIYKSVMEGCIRG